jgi:hypothetical protein
MVDGIVTNEPYMQNIIAIATEKDVTYQNYLGNMLGKDNYHDVYERNAEGCPNGFYDKLIYRTGYNSSGSCDSSHNAWNTLFRHMNYDTVSRSVKYCDSPGEPGCQGSSGDHQLPDSFYLTSKPSWWGDLTWPPFGPDPATADNKIPAQLRFENLPAIENFTANPAVIVQGQSSALSWIVTAADSLSIDHGLGTMSGTSTIVSPTATTTYKLTATNSTGSSTADVTVMVQGSGNGESGGGGGGGGGCFMATAEENLTLGPNLLPLFLFFIGISLLGWRWKKLRAKSEEPRAKSGN